jgi:hypothetical protein
MFAYCHYSVVRDVINRQLIAMIHCTSSKLSYRIDIDFCLHRQGAGSNNSSSASFESAFSFSVPIEVLVKRQLLIYPSNILGGKLTHDATETAEHTQKCMSSAEYVQQRIIECLDSDIVSYPLQCRSK